VNSIYTMLSTDYLLVNYVVFCCVSEGAELPLNMGVEEARGILSSAAEIASQMEMEDIEYEDDFD
jgi:hypothetical protein